MAKPSRPVGPAGTVTLAEARSIVDAALAEAERRKVRVAVAVSGPAGDLLAFARMDGIPPISAESARHKCLTVAVTWKSTADFAASLRGDLEAEPEYFHGMHNIVALMTVGGGVPLVRDGHLAGAVAVSGASTADDIGIAEHAAATGR
ncbi:MAG TPA: heme-binding protein [Candidatus Acidoferrum sp.]|nr:heme-binding protein [Candidatus Acidoferrum sp.]